MKIESEAESVTKNSSVQFEVWEWKIKMVCNERRTGRVPAVGMNFLGPGRGLRTPDRMRKEDVRVRHGMEKQWGCEGEGDLGKNV